MARQRGFDSADIRRRDITVLVIGVAMLCLAACGGDADEAAEAPAVRKAVPAKPDDPTAKMARAVTVGKSSVPIDLKYEIAGKPMMGQPIEIELALLPTQGADSISMTFAPSAGLTLSADTAPNVDVVKAGVPHRVALSATAATPDVFYVTVTTTLHIAGTTNVRTFAIPLILSDPTATVPATAEAPAKKS